MKNAIIFLVGFCVYITIEVLYRALSNFPSLIGATSLYMGVLGGVILLLLGNINELKLLKKFHPFIQSLIGVFIITLLELIFGIILNVWFKFGIWDYSNLPFNFLGQICIQFSFLWWLLTPFAFWLDDTLRYCIYNFENNHVETKPDNVICYYLDIFKRS